MKKIQYLYSLICLALLWTGCSKDFLKESSVDLVKPTTTEALNQLLTGEAYPTDVSYPAFHAYLELMTDDVQSNFTNEAAYINRFNVVAPAYTWNADMLDQVQVLGGTSTQTYFNYYQRIKGCNVVLDNISVVSGPEADKRNIRGQALALRAYYHFMLANLFGKPYNHGNTNVNIDPAVPLMLSATVTDELRPRNTLKEVYDQVEKDLTEAVDLLPDPGTVNSLYRFTNTAAAAFASRFFLYKNDWDKAIQYANLALTKAPALRDLNAVTATSLAMLNPVLAGHEIIFAYANNADFALVGTAPSSSGKAPFTISDDLFNLYENNDLRKNLYVSKGLYITSTLVLYNAASAKGSGSNSQKAIRTSELYLNRAEAYLQKALLGDAAAVTAALADLNELRRRRYTAASFQELTITDPAQLLALYKNERRKELFFEDQRWFDLRRWGMPKLVHTYQIDATVQTATLAEADNRYTLRLPQDVLLRNPSLTQNP